MKLIPQDIVKELDKHIVGQENAKKAVAIALVNRERRRKVDPSIKRSIHPKNILMVGPTGIGKTEICRHIAQMIDAPFIKVDATKYTEIGYVGKDVESIIRDLIELEAKRLKAKKFEALRGEAQQKATDEVIRLLLLKGEGVNEEVLERFRQRIELGEMLDEEVEIEFDPTKNMEHSSNIPFGSLDIPSQSSMIGIVSASDLFGKIVPGNTKKKKSVKVSEAIEILTDEALYDSFDAEEVSRAALKSVESEGIVFIDEIDKIAVSNNAKGGEVSREGVQRDLLPLLEGTLVNTKFGMVQTDYILFIASGAFHSAAPSDLSPELQGRLPVRVDLKPLTREDIKKILTVPEASLIKQYQALLNVEEVSIEFTEDGIDSIVDLTVHINSSIDNTGARRLFGIMEKLMEEASFNTAKYKGQTIMVDKKYVNTQLKSFLDTKRNLEKFII